MKKQLVSMLLTGLMSVSAFANPPNLERRVSAQEGYNVSLFQEYTLGGTNHLTHITDSDTDIKIVDLGNDGMNDGDYLTFDHTFVSKEKLKFKITYKGDDHYFNEAWLYSEDNSKIVEADLDTRKVNKLIYYFVKKMTRKTVDKTKSMYGEVFTNALAGSTADIPYTKIKEGISEFECSLPELKQSSKKFEKGLIGLTKKYMEIINQKKSSSCVDLLFSSDDSKVEPKKGVDIVKNEKNTSEPISLSHNLPKD